MLATSHKTRHESRSRQRIPMASGKYNSHFQCGVCYDLGIRVDDNEREERLESVTLVGSDRLVHCLTEKESVLRFYRLAPGDVNIDSSIKTRCIKILAVLD